VRTVLVVVALAVIAAGCSTLTGTPPAPTPADFPGLASTLGRHGVRVGDIVAGDPGCDDPGLVPTAIRFDASGLDQPAPTRAYVYIFRTREAFDRLRRDVARCAENYVTDEEGEPWIAASPFVLTGPGPWSPGFRKAMEEALIEAAGTGG
jgi:hypothetical protein